MTCFFVPASHGASKSTKLISTFDTYVKNINLNLKVQLQEAELKYSPLIVDAEKNAQESFNRLKNSNRATVTKLGNNRSYWGQFECPIERPNCIGADKGPEFKVGEVISFKESTLKDLDQLYVNELIIQDGLVQMFDLAAYKSASESFRNAMLNLSSATVGLAKARASANSSHAESMLISEAIKYAKIAAKRAEKNPGSFEKSFVTSFVFDFNRTELNKYASTPFSEIKNFKALNEVFEVTKLSKQAELISARYRLVDASKLNKICGTEFTNEPRFKSDFKKIAELYKLATNISISLKM